MVVENSIYLMSGLGQGIRSGIFIYIFRSFFKGLPKELEEAAQVEVGHQFLEFFGTLCYQTHVVQLLQLDYSRSYGNGMTHITQVYFISTEAFPILTMRLVISMFPITYNTWKPFFYITNLVSTFTSRVLNTSWMRNT